jgi:hypothetical protein
MCAKPVASGRFTGSARRTFYVAATMASLLASCGAIATSADASQRCTPAHRCSKAVKAGPHLRRWRTPQTFGRNASLQVRVVTHGHQMHEADDGLTVIFRGRGALITATAHRGRGPIDWYYVARGRLRLRLVYWAE